METCGKYNLGNIWKHVASIVKHRKIERYGNPNNPVGSGS